MLLNTCHVLNFEFLYFNLITVLMMLENYLCNIDYITKK
jgi:hypothetical protein